MPTGRRLVTLLVALSLVAFPAVALRVFCLGKSCDSGDATASASIPFCPLPARVRALIGAGFRQGRSPDVLAVTDIASAVRTSVGERTRVPWPSSVASADTRVPIAFFGQGFTGASPPNGTGLDQIAPTVAQAIGYRRTHPEVRAGTPAPGIAGPTGAPHAWQPFVVEIAWKGVGTSDLESEPHAWPFLKSLMRDGGGTLDGTTGSLPLDPAATLTTIGTGGLPSQHGIIGSIVRGDDGQVARAWSPAASGSVIASLADDIDRSEDQRARIGAIIDERTDRGIVGDGWYVDRRDRDDLIVTDRPITAVDRLLDDGYGTDGNVGVIGVVVRDSVGQMDRMTGSIVRAVRARVPTATFIVTATGSLAGSHGDDAARVTNQVESALGAPVVEATGVGGLFLDRGLSTKSLVTADDLATEVKGLRDERGTPVFADAFPSFAVAFARYC